MVPTAKGEHTYIPCVYLLFRKNENSSSLFLLPDQQTADQTERSTRHAANDGNVSLGEHGVGGAFGDIVFGSHLTAAAAQENRGGFVLMPFDLASGLAAGAFAAVVKDMLVLRFIKEIAEFADAVFIAVFTVYDLTVAAYGT